MSAPGIPADFWIPVGRALPARVLGASVADGVVVLTIELAHDEWEMADTNMLFHLQWNDRDEGEIVEGGDVRIEMRLAPDLVADALALVAAAAVEDVDGDALAATIAGLDRDHPLRSTRSWYAMRVTEDVPLPPELAAKGDVRTGFTTKWSRESP